ncbi:MULTISPECIES: hypothetical protein [unclassified Streptomyces]|uniref:hypothetical protein n=1 Tax=unclassified Streptomyces TaxID=2593676 RepID=UPI002E1F822A|nr:MULTISPECIES: hypothetical protein [unclassified Streptomyces]
MRPRSATDTCCRDELAYAAHPRVRDPRGYVTHDVWDGEIQLLMRDHPVDEVLANRLFGAANSYLITAMEKWGQGLEMCCGRLVELAVHAFILDTKNYRESCAAHFGGRFLEHIRENEFKYDGSVERTAQITADAGFHVDWKLLERDYGKCGPCSPGRTGREHRYGVQPDGHRSVRPPEESNAPRSQDTGRILGQVQALQGEGTQPGPQADRFDWTQHPAHGPGSEVLGLPRRALELGPAEGKEATHLARQGVEVTGVAFSPVQVARA